MKPIKSHLVFEKYYVFVDKKKGLYMIKATSSITRVNPYGTEIKNDFDSLADDLMSVGLGCIADSPFSAHLLLEYDFKNSKNGENDQDSVF